MTLLCDFCATCDPAWSYPCKSFTFGISRSLGAWAACDECHALIDADDRDDLADRSLEHWERLQDMHVAESAQLLAILRDIHVIFWESRTGPAEPLVS